MITVPIIAWLSTVFGLPLACVILARTRTSLARMRVVNISAATVLLAVTSIPVFAPSLRDFSIPAPGFVSGTGSLLRLDELSLVLPALAAFLWLFTIAVTPKLLFGADRMRGTSVSTVFTLLAFLTEHSLVLAVAWAGSVVAMRGVLVTTRSKMHHAAGKYLNVSMLLFTAGAILLAATQLTPRGSRPELVALCLLVAGAMIRKGIIPAHAWVPALFEHGRLGPAILFSSPQWAPTRSPSWSSRARLPSCSESSRSCRSSPASTPPRRRSSSAPHVARARTSS